jgi:hypothetical protein
MATREVSASVTAQRVGPLPIMVRHLMLVNPSGIKLSVFEEGDSGLPNSEATFICPAGFTTITLDNIFWPAGKYIWVKLDSGVGLVTLNMW